MFLVLLDCLFQFIEFVATEKTLLIKNRESLLGFFQLIQLQEKFPEVLVGATVIRFNLQCLLVVGQGNVIMFQLTMTVGNQIEQISVIGIFFKGLFKLFNSLLEFIIFDEFLKWGQARAPI